MKIKFDAYKLLFAIHVIIGFLYFPVYAACWLLHKVARLVLGICYYGMLDFHKGKNVIKGLFW